MPSGSVYKIEGNAGDKKVQGATQPLDASDWDSFRVGSGSAQTEQWWRDNMDLEKYFSFRACNRITGNVDVREGWNHCFYHRPDGVWEPVPWDLDMMFIAKNHWSGTIVQKSCLTHAAISLEFRNRCREILDLLLADNRADGGQIGQLIDEYAQIVNPAGEALTGGPRRRDVELPSAHPRRGGHVQLPDQPQGQLLPHAVRGQPPRRGVDPHAGDRRSRRLRQILARLRDRHLHRRRVGGQQRQPARLRIRIPQAGGRRRRHPGDAVAQLGGRRYLRRQ
ncbi:MAG: CotH kinase family protein [Verrucomicrobiales bacterium]